MTLHDETATVQAAPPARRAPVKERKYSVLARRKDSDGVTVLTVEIAERHGKGKWDVALYHVWGIPSDFGRAFMWQGIARKGGSRYHVNLAEEGSGEPALCGCIGHEAGRVAQCRHVACSLALIANGSI